MLIEWVTSSVFNEIAALLMLAAVVGAVGMMLRQPLIVSFIIVGILAGPWVLNIVRSDEPIELFAQLGIAILLFLVGIKLDVNLIRTQGGVALAAGLGQVVFTALFGFFICLALGMNATTSFYVSVAITFSSTIIVVKLLSDRREIDSLHGRIAVGILIVQDLVVVLALLVLSAVAIGARDDATSGEVARVFIAGGLMLGFVLIFVRYLAEPLTERLAKTPELLISFAIALAALFAALGETIGFGKELGGLLAGVALASTSYRDAISARLAPLRDFLLLFFFISLGAALSFGNLGEIGFDAAVLSLFVLIGNPLIVLLVMLALGYRKRPGFLAGVVLAQISEFSLIFMTMAVSIGHVSSESLALVTLVGLITIAASTYMITYSHELYAFCEPLLRVFERHGTREGAPDKTERFDVIVFGLGRYGGTMGRLLARDGKRVLGVDFNPSAVRRWNRDALEAVYGDASDPEFLATLPLAHAAWVVSSVPEQSANIDHADARIVLIQTLRRSGFKGKIAVTSHRDADVEALRKAGASLVLRPFQDAADRAVELLELKAKPALREPSEPEEQKAL